MSVTLTTLEYMLIGLISRWPMSGYDVHRLFATTPLAHFSSSPGAIYPALRRLERRGLLKATLDVSTEARPRRVYSLTDAGDAALEAWLHQQVDREELIRNPTAPLARFSLSEGRLSPHEVIAYLTGYRGAVTAYLEELQPYRKAPGNDMPLHGRLSLENGLRGYESEVRWIEYAIAEIRRMSAAKVRSPGGTREKRISRRRRLQ